jgi:hypothetical protein
MYHFRQAVPAKEEEPNERGFEEKGHQTFDGERRAEDVADIVTEIGPFIPNWNSMVMPVATPMAKLTPNRMPRILSLGARPLCQS